MARLDPAGGDSPAALVCSVVQQLIDPANRLSRSCRLK
jgi:hypothetical protein